MALINKTKGYFISFLLGGVIGSGIALLFAPKPGKQLRKDISRKTNEFIDDSRKKTSDIMNGAKEFADNTLDNANEVLNTGVEKIVRKTEKIKEALKAGVNKYKDEKNSGSNQRGSELEDVENTHRDRS